MTNWKNRLKSKLADLDVLFSEECTQADAIQAWYGFFNHDFWIDNETVTEHNTLQSFKKSVRSFVDNEQFIDDLFPVRLKYNCKISCQVSGNGWRPKPISELLAMLRHYLPHNFEIRCTMAYTNCPSPYRVFWKVKNVGVEAEKRNQLRGEIYEKGNSIVEHSKFFGKHYIECYIISNGVCVAMDKVEIPIGRS